MARKALASTSIKASGVRALAARKAALTLAQHNSIRVILFASELRGI
jgi:hypothetical protein